MSLNPTQGGERKKSRRSWRILTVKPQFRAFRCGRNIVNMPPKNTLVSCRKRIPIYFTVIGTCGINWSMTILHFGSPLIGHILSNVKNKCRITGHTTYLAPISSKIIQIDSLFFHKDV